MENRFSLGSLGQYTEIGIWDYSLRTDSAGTHRDSLYRNDRASLSSPRISGWMLREIDRCYFWRVHFSSEPNNKLLIFLNIKAHSKRYFSLWLGKEGQYADSRITTYIRKQRRERGGQGDRNPCVSQPKLFNLANIPVIQPWVNYCWRNSF